MTFKTLKRIFYKVSIGKKQTIDRSDVLNTFYIYNESIQ